MVLYLLVAIRIILLTLSLANIALIVARLDILPCFVALTSLTLTGNHVGMVASFLPLGGTALKCLIVQHTFLLLYVTANDNAVLWALSNEFVYTDSPGPRASLTDELGTSLPLACVLDDDFYNCPLNDQFMKCTNVSSCTSATAILTSVDDWNNTRVNEYACASDVKPFVYSACPRGGKCQWACYVYSCTDYSATIIMNTAERGSCFAALNRADDISFGVSMLSYQPAATNDGGDNQQFFFIDLGYIRRV
jgi:hypothetical protein